MYGPPMAQINPWFSGICVESPKSNLGLNTAHFKLKRSANRQHPSDKQHGQSKDCKVSHFFRARNRHAPSTQFGNPPHLSLLLGVWHDPGRAFRPCSLPLFRRISRLGWCGRRVGHDRFACRCQTVERFNTWPKSQHRTPFRDRNLDCRPNHIRVFADTTKLVSWLV